ncbi:MAG TPA: hypothetical protein VG405_06560 [Solirubrobacteraceae bacterium]|jgi:hypothetical protein|nr:hypothetical protein [Solirubrobacteraceae bacterium]
MAVEAPQSYKPEDLRLWSLVSRYRWFALAALAVLVILAVMLLVAVLGPKAGAVTDSTACSQWGSTNQTKQAAYARQYVRRHGSLADGASSVAAIESAINTGCMAAYASDEEDTITVLQSIRKQY